MRRRFLLMSLWIAALAVCPCGPAFAADEVDLETVAAELRAADPSLTDEEARQLTQEAARDVVAGTAAERGDENSRGLEQGVFRQGLGAPDLGGGTVGGGPGYEMTPEEQAFAEEVTAAGREAGQRLWDGGLRGEELENEVDRQIKEQFGERFKEFSEEKVRKEGDEHDLPEVKGKDWEAYREQMERESGRPTPEQIERYRELGGHEIDRPAVERGMFEREQVTHEPVERPTAEQPTRETERPTHERPEGMPGY